MRKLLSANFSRLWKSKVFWLEIGVTILLSGIICITNYQPNAVVAGYRVYLDDIFFSYYLYIGLVISVCVSLILGTEYADGTLRNKLIVGHTRAAVYFSNLITQLIASFLAIAIHLAILCTLGRGLLGGLQMPVEQAAAAMAWVFLAVGVITGICVLISMNCASKANGAVISILLQLALLYAAAYIQSMLMEPEMTYDDVIVTSGSAVFGDPVANPAYVGGLARRVLEFGCDLLPQGQLLQIYAGDCGHSMYWAWLSVILMAVITAAGFLAFRRKNLK